MKSIKKLLSEYTEGVVIRVTYKLPRGTIVKKWIPLDLFLEFEEQLAKNGCEILEPRIKHEF